jgi:hypothetical protein
MASGVDAKHRIRVRTYQREWVYNRADIDNQQVVWAREMDPAENRRLLNYYGDRQAWLLPVTTVEESVADVPPKLLPYAEPLCRMSRSMLMRVHARCAHQGGRIVCINSTSWKSSRLEVWVRRQ